MRRVLAYLSALAVAGALVVTFARPALAANGEAVVFIADYTDLAVFDNPSGCQLLPVGSHVLVNQTDEPITLYGDPVCAMPGPVLEPGHGAHVPPYAGSFEVN